MGTGHRRQSRHCDRSSQPIEDLFDLIDRAEAEGADDVHVEYAREGYPTVVNIDWIRQAVDDEMFMGVSEVVVGVSQID